MDIFERDTPPRLRTDSVEIRTKIAAPKLREGFRYFAVLYRGSALIGFAMFGYYQTTKLVVIDHMVIAKGERGDSAFLAFAALLIDELHFLAVDYIAIEVSLDSKKENRASGVLMMRLLSRIDFGKAKVRYCLPATDARALDVRYEGVLMLKTMHKTAGDFAKIRRVEIERITRTILFKHYYDWYREFWAASDLKLYKAYLNQLFKEFKSGIKGDYVAIAHFIRRLPDRNGGI